MMVWAGVSAAAASLAITALLVPLTRRIAERTGMLDMPGRHKAHGRVVPLLGGCAIMAGVALPAAAGLLTAWWWGRFGAPDWLPEQLRQHVPGAAMRAGTGLAILAGALALHVMGLVDDRRALGPWVKLAVQLAVAAGVTMAAGLRVLEVLGEPLSVALTILWLTAITNAFNFLDNMDGLSAGVAAICAAALLGAAAGMGQLFVAGGLCLVLGATLGFLPYNFPPARTFMGDAGSLVLGFLLGCFSVLTTYVAPGRDVGLAAALVPLVLMAVPLYDMGSVMVIRLREGRNPMVGDRMHFSHRLARRGMGSRAVVLTIYLCTAATAIAATLLPQVRGAVGAVLVVLQTLAVLGIIAILESRGSKP